MGLFDIEGADPNEYPDNKGGRPPKDEEEEIKKVQPSHVVEMYPPDDEDDEEFFARIWRELHDGNIVETIGRFCDHTALPPWEVMRHLHNHKIHDFTDYDETPYSREYLRRSGILDTNEVKQNNILSSLGGSSSSSDDNDDDTGISSGLKSLIDD